MALALNVINRRGPSNEMRRQLNPKKDNIKLYLAVYIATEDFTCPSLLKRRSASVLKVGVLYMWKMTKRVAS